MKTSKKTNGQAFEPFKDLNTWEALAEFQRAAKAFHKRVNRTPATALAELVAEGIYTKKGKLTKNYR